MLARRACTTVVNTVRKRAADLPVTVESDSEFESVASWALGARAAAKLVGWAWPAWLGADKSAGKPG